MVGGGSQFLKVSPNVREEGGPFRSLIESGGRRFSLTAWPDRGFWFIRSSWVSPDSKLRR